MLYRQLSKLAVVGERSEAPKANQSRLRRPTPYSIEQYRHEGVRASKDDNRPVDSPRGRSQSSTWTPTRTRAPTPHPSATKSRRRKEEKTVHWTDSLEQESPEQKCDPVPAPSRKKSALKRQPATEQKEEKSTEKEEDRPDNSSEEPAKPKTDAKAGSQEDQPRTLRRDRRSSIPRPKFIVSRNTSKPITLPSVAPERPPSPLIPQPIPAPLRLSQRRSQIPAIPSSASAPAITDKTAARDFSFDDKPERITVGSRSAHEKHPSNTTKNNLSTSRPTSYLQVKPKRNGTTRTRPTPPIAEREPARAEDSSEIKNSSSASPSQARATEPAASLPKSSSTQSFNHAKTFWTEKSSSARANDSSDRDASKPKSTSMPAPAKVDVASTRNSSPSKPQPLPSSTSASSFQSAKRFWSSLGASSSCGAIVDGSISEPVKPVLSHGSKDLPKTSMVSSLSAYTVNAGGRSNVDEKHGASKSRVSGSVSSTAVTGSSRLPRSSSALPYRPAKRDMTAPAGSSISTSSSMFQSQKHSQTTTGSSVSNTSSYHTAPSHLTSASTSNTGTKTSTSMAATSTSLEAEHIPSIQSELWNEIMDFCRSDSSSPMPGEQRYCDCDDCVWSNEKDLKECSTVARVGNNKGNCKARRE